MTPRSLAGLALAAAALVAACTGDPTPVVGDASGGWERLASMSVPRSETPAVVVGAAIYVAGGLGQTEDGFVAFDTTEAFDTTTGSWSTLTPLPEPRHHHAIAAFDGAVYVIGGYDSGWQPQSTVWRYDPVTDAWTAVQPLPFPVAAGAAATIDDAIYLVAGVGRPQALLMYDPVTDTWVERAAMPEPREHLAIVERDGRLYVAGGRWSLTGETGALEVYDPESDTWQVLAAMIQARAGHGMSAAGGDLVAVGGELLGRPEALASVELYDLATGTWRMGPELPVTTHGVATVSVADQIYVVGGAPTANQADARGEVYRLVADPGGTG